MNTIDKALRKLYYVMYNNAFNVFDSECIYERYYLIILPFLHGFLENNDVSLSFDITKKDNTIQSVTMTANGEKREFRDDSLIMLECRVSPCAIWPQNESMGSYLFYSQNTKGNLCLGSDIASHKELREYPEYLSATIGDEIIGCVKLTTKHFDNKRSQSIANIAADIDAHSTNITMGAKDGGLVFLPRIDVSETYPPMFIGDSNADFVKSTCVDINYKYAKKYPLPLGSYDWNKSGTRCIEDAQRLAEICAFEYRMLNVMDGKLSIVINDCFVPAVSPVNDVVSGRLRDVLGDAISLTVNVLNRYESVIRHYRWFSNYDDYQCDTNILINCCEEATDIYSVKGTNSVTEAMHAKLKMPTKAIIRLILFDLLKLNDVAYGANGYDENVIRKRLKALTPNNDADLIERCVCLFVKKPKSDSCDDSDLFYRVVSTISNKPSKVFAKLSDTGKAYLSSAILLTYVYILYEVCNMLRLENVKDSICIEVTGSFAKWFSIIGNDSLLKLLIYPILKYEYDSNIRSGIKTRTGNNRVSYEKLFGLFAELDGVLFKCRNWCEYADSTVDPNKDDDEAVIEREAIPQYACKCHNSIIGKCSYETAIRSTFEKRKGMFDMLECCNYYTYCQNTSRRAAQQPKLPLWYFCSLDKITLSEEQYFDLGIDDSMSLKGYTHRRAFFSRLISAIEASSRESQCPSTALFDNDFAFVELVINEVTDAMKG